MWIATQHGFYSCVIKVDGVYVRARVRADLVNLLNLWKPAKKVSILKWPEADYRYRIIVSPADLIEILAAVGTALNYPNFKSKIAATPDQREKLQAYSELWHNLLDLQK